MPPNKGANETALTTYPSLSVENNVGFALEADFLQAALEEKDKAAVRPLLRKWLAARTLRWQPKLPAEAIAYEDAVEFSEGTAKYVEYRLSQCLEGLPTRPTVDDTGVQRLRGPVGGANRNAGRCGG